MPVIRCIAQPHGNRHQFVGERAIDQSCVLLTFVPGMMPRCACHVAYPFALRKILDRERSGVP